MKMQKLLNIQKDLKAPKSQYNSFGQYNYRNCEDILEAVKPLCARENACLTLSDTVVQIGERYYIQACATLFDGETGEIINTVTAYAREGAEKKGMDSSQVTGAASSYARKYALNGLFNIDDTKDADSDEKPAQASKSGNTAAKGAAAGNETEDLKNSPQSEKAAVRRAWVRTIAVGDKEVRLGDLSAEKLQKFSEKAKDKSLRDDMLRVMQYKFTEAAKAETADLPFKDVGKGNAEG